LRKSEGERKKLKWNALVSFKTQDFISLYYKQKKKTPEYPKHKLITTSTELRTIENPNSYQTFPHSLLCSSGWDPI